MRAAGSDDRDIADKIDTLAKAQASLDMFSGTLLVARHGEIVYSGAFGMANRGHFIPNRLETRHNVGSIGKIVTAVAVFQLIQVGHSGGTDGVEAYFYRFAESGYTLVVLSNYTNGAEELTSSIMALLFGESYALPTRTDADFRLGYRMQGEGKLRDAAAVFARNLTTDPPHLLSLFFAANVRIRGNSSSRLPSTIWTGSCG